MVTAPKRYAQYGTSSIALDFTSGIVTPAAFIHVLHQLIVVSFTRERSSSSHIELA